MKKILSLALAALMMVSALPVAYAADVEVSQGTQVELVGPGGEYTVTVPAKISSVEDVGTVTAKGYWGNDQFLSVIKVGNIHITNTKTGQTTTAGVHFDGIHSYGDDFNEMTVTSNVSLADNGGIRFGTWTGTIQYIVRLHGIGSCMKINDVQYFFDGGMTFADWIESDYNTDGFYIDADTNYVLTADGTRVDTYATSYIYDSNYSLLE